MVGIICTECIRAWRWVFYVVALSLARHVIFIGYRHRENAYSRPEAYRLMHRAATCSPREQ